MNILFVNLSALRFTAVTPDHAPLGGSESSLCYLARALARRGHDVALCANLPDGTPQKIENIRHYPLTVIKDASFFATNNFNAIILCNAPAAAAPIKEFAPDARIILWAHALPDQPSMQSLARPQTKQSLDATVFVSAWQQDEVMRVFGGLRALSVIGNGIAPSFEKMFASADEILNIKENRAAYTTTPYRGLSVLVRAMQGLDAVTKLDVFSSMQVYQADNGDYASILEQAAQHPSITCHGSVTQGELAQRLRACAFLFYPCIYPETFCITAAEAMAAGMKIVTTDLGALKDTTMGFADLVPINSSDGDVLVRSFREAMQRNVAEFMEDRTAWARKMFAQSQQANKTFSWDGRASQWEKVLSALL